MNVPWLSKETISRKATELIDGFQALAKYEVKPPIPVEDIIERYLGLRLIYDDLTRVFGRDVLGTVYVESKLSALTNGFSRVVLRGDWFLPSLTRWDTGYYTVSMLLSNQRPAPRATADLSPRPPDNPTSIKDSLGTFVQLKASRELKNTRMTYQGQFFR